MADEPVVVDDLEAKALEMTRSAGVVLDEWQSEPLTRSLEYRGDGLWRYPEVTGIVPRQNGKGEIILPRQLTGLFLDPDCRLQIYTAHLYTTALSAFIRLLDVVESTPSLNAQVKRTTRSTNETGIELHDGSKILFKTRSNSSGRGLSCDLLYLDEAMILSEVALAALYFTLSARPNAQVWFVGSAVDQLVHDHGLVLARMRARGHAGDPGLLFFEHAATAELEELLREPARLADRALWREANPALETRISLETVERELQAMSPRSFCVERLGVGDWPALDASGSAVIPPALWSAGLDAESQPGALIAFAFDVSPDRSRASIGAASRRLDGQMHAEVIDARDGTGWLPDRLAELVAKHGIKSVRCDVYGPAGSLLPALAERGIDVKTTTSQEAAQACGAFLDLVSQDKLRHIGQAPLTAAVAGAATRELGDGLAWRRKRSTVDITPLVAVTLAAWDAAQIKPRRPVMVARS